MKKYSSTLSTKRIVITLLIFLIVPFLIHLMKEWIGSLTITTTFALNLAGWILLMYDWNLFGTHWNRAKQHPGDTVLYSLIGIAAIGIWTMIDLRFLHGIAVLPDLGTMREYSFGLPAFLLAYSYVQALIVNIGFKAMTDHISIQHREAMVILISGFLFGALYTVSFSQLHLYSLVPSYLYNVILVSLLAYLYNQSGSIIPGILAMGTVYFICMILMLA